MDLTRRRLLAQISALTAGVAGAHTALAQFGFRSRRPKAQPAQPALVYFGTDTLKPGAQGIYMARFDAKGAPEHAVAGGGVLPAVFYGRG